MKADPKKLPELPGVYLMKDGSGDIIYVGKAKSLGRRVRQYFQSSRNLSPKTVTLVRNIDDIEYIVTDSEIDALVLEANLIKKHRPRYNVRLKDDKRYPYVKVTVNSEFPRIFLARRRLMDGALYFGPYTNAKAIRATLDIISRVFMLRRCKKRVDPGRSRPCLNYHIKRCLAPCKSGSGNEEYHRRVMASVRFLKGDTKGIIKDLEKKMQHLSQIQDYEAAALVRDDIRSIELLSEQQITSLGSDDRDVLAAVADEEAIYIQLFYVRHGSMVGKADFTLLGADVAESIEESVAQFIKQYYQDSPIPPEILVQYELPDKELIVTWLSRRSAREVRLHVPKRGEKKKLVEMAEKNAQMAKNMASIKPPASESARMALEELQRVLSLQSLPRHIEGFDISNISGAYAVGSMVFFEDGKPANNRYRQHNIRTVEGMDDFAMILEVVNRRYSRLLKDNGEMPDLILIDGGPGQLSAASSALQDLGLEIPIIGLAKRFEHIITTKKGSDEVIILPHTSPGLKLLMHIRDEAHRFAVSSHRRRRSASLTHSKLDSIPGVGTSRKRTLLEKFGSVERICSSSVEEICSLQGINEELAYRILEHLKS